MRVPLLKNLGRETPGLFLFSGRFLDLQKEKNMLKLYLKNLSQVTQTGDAREESYYSCLKDFLDNFARSTGKTNIHITVLPKKTEAGNPDFRIWDGRQKIVGYSQ